MTEMNFGKKLMMLSKNSKKKEGLILNKITVIIWHD
jgi:hypothetical protein